MLEGQNSSVKDGSKAYEEHLCIFYIFFFGGGGRKGGAGVMPAVLEETLSKDYLFFAMLINLLGGVETFEQFWSRA